MSLRSAYHRSTSSLYVSLSRFVYTKNALKYTTWHEYLSRMSLRSAYRRSTSSWRRDRLGTHRQTGTDILQAERHVHDFNTLYDHTHKCPIYMLWNSIRFFVIDYNYATILGNTGLHIFNAVLWTVFQNAWSVVLRVRSLESLKNLYTYNDVQMR